MRKKNNEIIKSMLNYIDHYSEEYGKSPSNLEIAEATGASASMVCRYLQYLRENDLLDSNNYVKQSEARKAMMPDDVIMVPIVGRVACGLPRFAEQNIESYVAMSRSQLGPGEFFILTANGDSMTEIGIDDGDQVVIRRQTSARPGDIVVAFLQDEEVATLKRYFPEPKYHRVRLHPENRNMQDIYVDDCMIQGVAVKVTKDLCD